MSQMQKHEENKNEYNDSTDSSAEESDSEIQFESAQKKSKAEIAGLVFNPNIFKKNANDQGIEMGKGVDVLVAGFAEFICKMIFEQGINKALMELGEHKGVVDCKKNENVLEKKEPL